MTHANPFAVSTCGRFVVERDEGDIYPNVMTVAEAVARLRRLEAAGALYEGEADGHRRDGDLTATERALGFARINLTQAHDLFVVLGGAESRRAAA